MTPCEKLGYKVGDEFEVVKEGSFGNRVGDILVLREDDGTNEPYFYSERRNTNNACCNISSLRKLPPEWNGEGLPPVGTVCEFDEYYGFKEGKIVAHITLVGGDKVAYIQYPGGGYGCSRDASKFRKIKPKKTEAELMEEIFNKSGIQGLIDAGYHK
jgi:hypothetical protein